MYDGDGAALEVGFAIDTAGSFENLMRLQQTMGSTEAKVLADATRIEKATKSMVDLAPATAMFNSFAPAATRALRDVARETAAAEKAGERLVSRLERQSASFGKSRSELRAMNAEEAALAAERVGNADLAARLRAAEAAIYEQEFALARKLRLEVEAAAEAKEEAAQKAMRAAEAEAEAVRHAAFAYNLFETNARSMMAAHTAAERAQQTAAASADSYVAKLEAETRALGRTTSELRAMEVAQRAAAAEAAGMPDQAARIRAAGDAYAQAQMKIAAANDTMVTSAKRGSGALTQLSFQINDVATMAASGSPPFQILATQAGQIVQVFQMAEGGAKGLAHEIGGLLLRFSPLIGIAGAAAAGLGLFVRWVNQGVTNNQLTKDLGDITGGADATKQELYKLKDAEVEWGDLTKALFTVVGKDVAASFVGDMKGMSKDVKSLLDDLTSYGRKALAGLYAGVAGTKAYLAEVEKGGILGIGKMLIGQGDPKLLEKTYGAAYDAADKYLGKLGARVKTAAIQNARERLAKSIGYNNEPKPKTDRHAEQLAREAAAVEAQIRNLYALADAYNVSGAAALIAEARVKAESEAIKKRGDIEAAVARQVRLAVAQRVVDAAKSAAGMRDEATIQEQINAGVENGQIAAERANELLRDRMADLPILAALEAARTVGDVKGTTAATAALEGQRSAQDRLSDAQRRGRLLSAMASGYERLAELKEELRLVGATEDVRVRALATLRATQEASRQDWTGAKAADYIRQQADIASAQFDLTQAQDNYNDQLSATADLFDLIDTGAQRAASGIADAFGSVGGAIGDALTVMTGFYADQARLQEQHRAHLRSAGRDQSRIDRENYRFAMQSSSAQIGAYGDMAGAAKGFFKEGSAGYKALQAAETVYRVAQLAMSVQAMFQNTAETVTSVTNAGLRATADGAAGVAAQSKLPFPANLAAMAATVAALAAVGIAIGGALGGGGMGNTLLEANTGTGSVLGDGKAQSESIRRAIDQLKDVDTVTNTFARQMAGSLRSIDSQIGGIASVVVRAGNVNADAGVTEGFKANSIGSVLGAVPLIGGILKGLFGTSTTVLASGLYGGAQSIGDIMVGGFDASTYSDVQKKKKLFGITTSTKYSTQYGAIDGSIENQFTLLLKSFTQSIASAAVPLGQSTAEIEARLNGFVVNIGKIDLKGLTGTEIQEKLEAVFGAAADGMANAAFPGIERFQKVGEGAFETLVRVASTAEAVTNALSQMGGAALSMSLDAKIALANQFDTIGDLTSAVGSYFEAFYTPAEQVAARVAELTRVFDSMGLTMPTSLSGFRQLVEAQDLNTSAGQAAYATLLKLAPAFAELQEKMAGAKSAADVAAERQDLERQLLELRGDTAALRALELAKLDASNRALQEEIYAIQDAQKAAQAADELRQAWTSVGDSIMDEVERIRGLTATEQGGFATLLGKFNAANEAARGGDLDAAKMLPQLSQALLAAAADAATSRQELDRVRAQTAAQLETTYAAIGGAGASGSATSDAALLNRASLAQIATAPAPSNDNTGEVSMLRSEVATLRAEAASSQASIASSMGRIARVVENVTAASGGDAVSVVEAA